MSTLNKILKKIIGCGLVIVLAQATLYGQTTEPKWWFGVAGGANANFYDGTTQRLNNSLIVPAAFHKGKGIRPFGSVLAEFRPTHTWGGTLNVGFDGKGGKFKGVIAPCNCPATLSTNLSYLTIEPSLRLNPWTGNFYIFAGPRVAINLQKDFSYTQLKQPNTDSELSEVRKSLISAQVGVGYDIMVSGENSTTKFVISPFASFHPYFGQDVRAIESWSNTTVRAGIAFKFGSGKKVIKNTTVPVVPLPNPEVRFTVRAPKGVVAKRLVSETLPLLNYVFFDEGSTSIPERYTLLNAAQAANFKEDQLQNEQTVNSTGRSARQLSVYYHVLNILGDRMRANPSTNVTLSGASLSGPSEGRSFATAIQRYLVDVFAISASRITVEGRTKPLQPSEQLGGKKELALLREGDRRVDIRSTSSDLMMEVGGGMMKPVLINATQSNPTDGDVIFSVANATEILKSYTIDLTSQNGIVTHYGPYTRSQENVVGSSILGDNKFGDYKVVMIANMNNGEVIRKESQLHLENQVEEISKGMRYSILFNFNKSYTVATYEEFLKNTVAPLIADNSTVIIHGHTDVIGTEDYNHSLSVKRAEEVKQLLQNALKNAGKGNVKFERLGFGEQASQSPFDNGKPEERFYNRTVIIDINPDK